MQFRLDMSHRGCMEYSSRERVKKRCYGVLNIYLAQILEWATNSENRNIAFNMGLDVLHTFRL